MKTNEYDIRSAVVSRLLAEGLDRKVIRLEIPLDMNSSGGRADIVILKDGFLGCIELKSGRDKVKKDDIREQLRPYKRAFDYVGIVACSSHNEDDLPYDALYHFANEDVIGSRPWRHDPIPRNTPIYNHVSRHKSSIASVNDMVSILWRCEVAEIVGKKSAIKSKAVSLWSETKSRSEVRPWVVNALLERPHNLWEKKFWDKFDERVTPREIINVGEDCFSTGRFP